MVPGDFLFCQGTDDYLLTFDQNWRFSPDPEWLISPDPNTVYPPIQGKENRLFLRPFIAAKETVRPFIAAKETGGLDFLIAHALLIVCHSLFEVVIGQNL